MLSRLTTRLTTAQRMSVTPIAASSSHSEPVARGTSRRATNTTREDPSADRTIEARAQPTIQHSSVRRRPVALSRLIRKAREAGTSSNSTIGSAKNQPVSRRSNSATSAATVMPASPRATQKTGGFSVKYQLMSCWPRSVTQIRPMTARKGRTVSKVNASRRAVTRTTGRAFDAANRRAPTMPNRFLSAAARRIPISVACSSATMPIHRPPTTTKQIHPTGPRKKKRIS